LEFGSVVLLEHSSNGLEEALDLGLLGSSLSLGSSLVLVELGNLSLSTPESVVKCTLLKLRDSLVDPVDKLLSSSDILNAGKIQ
jgi:hypothetical protein